MRGYSLDGKQCKKGSLNVLFDFVSDKCKRPFYRYGGHIEFIIFKEYYWMPRVHSLSIYARFSSKKRTSMYISRQKVITIISKHGKTIFFSNYNLYLRKLKERLARTARVNTDASISDRADAPLGIPQYSSNPINSIWPPYR